MGYATPQTSVYLPALTSTTGLNELSLAINYPAGLGANAAPTPSPTQGLAAPTSGALDINDVYYVANHDRRQRSGWPQPVCVLEQWDFC